MKKSTEDLTPVGVVLDQLMKEKNIKINRLSIVTGIPERTLYNIRKTTNAAFDQIVRICEKTDFSLAEFGRLYLEELKNRGDDNHY